MGKIFVVMLVAAGIAAAMGMVSYHLLKDSMTAEEFIANALLNVLAEAVGVIIGLLFGVWLARRAILDRLPDVAGPLLSLIQQLREDKTISKDAARKGVIAAVRILSDGAFQKCRSCDSAVTIKQDCRICGLRSAAEPDSGMMRCKGCRLKGEAWAPLKST